MRPRLSARSDNPHEECGDLTMRRRVDGSPSRRKPRAVERAHLVDECEARRADTALGRVDLDVQRRCPITCRERYAEAEPPPCGVECIARDHDDRPGAGLFVTSDRVKSRKPDIALRRVRHAPSIGADRSGRSHAPSSTSISRRRSG